MVRQTMADDTNHDWTPDDLVEYRQDWIRAQAESDQHYTLFRDLFTPRARAIVLDVLLGTDQPLSAAQICEEGEISTTTFNDHRGALLDLGVIRRAGKVSNATTYELDRGHPAAQLLKMLDNVLRFGSTPMVLDERFVGIPSGEE